MKRFLMVLLAPLMLISMLFTTSPASAVASPWQPGQPVFTAPKSTPSVVGVNYHPMWGDMTATARAQVLDSLAAAGTQWVRIDVAWGTLQPTNASTYDSWGVGQIDTRIKEIRARGMKVLMMFYWAPAWSSGTTAKNGRPSNPADYANAAAWVAKRYDGSLGADLRIDGLELWNEPDLDSFWTSSPESTRISDFATLVKKAGAAVKAVAPSLKVIVGATASVNTDWYRTFYQTPGVIGTYDAIGIHPYQSPGDAAPSAYDAQYGQYYMKHIPVLSDLMTSMNDPAKLWATEFGWSTHSNTSSTPNWSKGVTEAQQATYLLDGLDLMAAYPRVEAAFWYNARNTNEGDTHFDSYGLSTLSNSPKPAYYAFKCAVSGVCGSTGIPAAPTNLTSTSVTSTTVSLTWTASAGATSYVVLRNGSKIGTTAKPSYVDSGLRRSTSYTYSVKAVSSAGTSASSSSLTVKTARYAAASLASWETAPSGLASGMATQN